MLVMIGLDLYEYLIQTKPCMSSSQFIYFLLHSQQYPFPKLKFLSLSKLPQQKRNIKKSILPDWVTPSSLLSIKNYIQTQQLPQLSLTPQQTQKLLSLSQFLCLQSFQQLLIQQHLLHNITPSNCVTLLIQAHKKLRNSDKSLTCWYNLLNVSMTYIANNMLLLYPKIKEEMKKLNQKILSEILERTVKTLRKNDYERKEEIFKVIMEMKGVEDIGRLCQELKEVVKKKKINPQIHANLSWKLKDLINIDLKKTKVFKFIDYEWKLQALASIENGKRQLNISLVLQSAKQGSEKSSASGQSDMQDFQQMNTDTVSGFNQNRKEGIMGNGIDFQRIGVLYLKLVSKIEQNTYQTDVRVNYLNIQQKQSIQLLEFNQNQLQQLGPKRIQITLYCSLQNVYTFIINYILQNYSLTTINLQHFCFEQLSQIAHFYIKDGKQVEALHVVLHLLHSKKCSEGEVRGLVLGLDYRRLEGGALKSVSDLLKLVGYYKLNDELMGPFKGEGVGITIPVAISRDRKERSENQYVLERASTSQNLRTNQNKITIQNRTPIESHSQVDLGIKSRGDSKQRGKKIFESPKRKVLTLEEQREQEKMRIDTELDIKKFIFLQDSAFCKTFM